MSGCSATLAISVDFEEVGVDLYSVALIGVVLLDDTSVSRPDIDIDLVSLDHSHHLICLHEVTSLYTQTRRLDLQMVMIFYIVVDVLTLDEGLNGALRDRVSHLWNLDYLGYITMGLRIKLGE